MFKIFTARHLWYIKPKNMGRCWYPHTTQGWLDRGIKGLNQRLLISPPSIQNSPSPHLNYTHLFASPSCKLPHKKLCQWPQIHTYSSLPLSLSLSLSIESSLEVIDSVSWKRWLFQLMGEEGMCGEASGKEMGRWVDVIFSE